MQITNCKLISFVVALATWASSVQAQSEQTDPALEGYFVANAAYNKRIFPVAAAQFELFLKKYPEHEKADLARQGLGLSQYALKQFDKANTQFALLLANKNLDKAIDRDRIIMLYGRGLLANQKAEDAKKLFVAEIENLKEPAFRSSALATICDVSFAKSDWEEVLAWTDKLLAAKPNPDQTARGLYQRGYAHYKKQDYEAAATSLEKVGNLAVDQGWKTRSAYLLGECRTVLKDYPAAEKAFSEAFPGMEGNEAAECLYRLGLTRFVLEKYEQAEKDFAEYSARPKDGDPENPHIKESKYYRGRCELEREDFRKAERHFSSLSEEDGDLGAKVNLWWARSFSRQENPNYDKAAEILENAVKNHSRSGLAADLEFDYANVLMARGEPDWKKAAGMLGRVEGKSDFLQLAEATSQRAVCFHKLGDYNNSLRSNERFLERHGQHELAGDNRFMKGENLFLLNRLDEAAKAYAEFIDSHADHSNRMAAAYRVAQIHHQKGRWSEALASAQPLLAKKPEGRLFAPLSFLVGDCFFRLEKWEEAITPLEDFVASYIKNSRVEKRPNVDTALMELGVSYDRTEDREKAKEHLTMLISGYGKETPHRPLALAELGRLAYQTSDLNLARKTLEQFLAEDKEDVEPFRSHAPAHRPKVMYFLGWTNADEKQYESAAQRFGEVRRLNGNHELVPDADLQQGIALVNGENYEVAAKHFDEMLRRYPEHENLAMLTFYAGLSLARVDNWNGASQYFKKVVENHPKAEFADQSIYEWAWCRRNTNRKEEAVKLYEQLLASYPQSSYVVKVQSELAELNLDSGAQEKVIMELSKTLESVKDESLREDLRFQLASAHFKKGDYEKSAEQFEALIRDYPKSKLMASMLFQAGESRFKLQETVHARDHFAAATQISGIPKALAESIWMRLGEMQTQTNQYKEAELTYVKFLQRFPDSTWERNARFGLGFAKENSDNPKGAIEEYRKLFDAEKVDLWMVRGRFQTGECYFNMQKYNEAIAEFVNLEINYKGYPDWQAKALLEIGRVLLAQGKSEEAAERFKDVIRRFDKEKAAIVARQYLDELRKN